jgi:hypothetical protein
VQKPRVIKSACPLVLLLALLLALSLTTTLGCKKAEASGADESTSSTLEKSQESGDIEGVIGAKIEVGDAVVTVRAVQPTFQPAMPTQRLSEETPSAPSAGQSFYQAYVRVENTGLAPLRVDPNDFACAVGDSVVSIEPTRSGPYPRSLLEHTSLDLLLTFKGPAGFQPVLFYSPSWYKGVISVGAALQQPEETTTTS